MVEVMDDVEKLVGRLAPDAICDDCIADRLELADRDGASRRARELAGSNGFERTKQSCSMCGIETVSNRQTGLS